MKISRCNSSFHRFFYFWKKHQHNSKPRVWSITITLEICFLKLREIDQYCRRRSVFAFSSRNIIIRRNFELKCLKINFKKVTIFSYKTFIRLKSVKLELPLVKWIKVALKKTSYLQFNSDRIFTSNKATS